ncbi:MAG TPA: MFS transporter [Gaiellaceae bacterium]|nr:MFS transporter [Gaiellaceae bacterium]
MSRPAQAAAALAAAMRNHGIRRVELAWGAAIVAEWAHFVALGVFAYDAGGTAAVGIAGVARMLPAALVAPLASSLGDRFRRERFLLATLVVAAGALAASALAFRAGRSELVIFALAAVMGISATVIRPTLQALLPSLARTPEELIAANGASSTIESLGTLVGPLLAGLLVAVTDAGVTFAAAGGVLIAGALLLAPLRVEGVIQETDATVPVRELVGGGLSAVKSGPALLIAALMATQCFVRGCLNVLIVVVAFRVLDAGAGAVGYLTAALGLGGLVGAFAAMTLTGRRLAVAFGAALVFWGVPIALVAPRPYLLSVVFLLAVVGAANSIEDVAGFTLLQRTVPDAVLNRVLGLVWGLAMGAVALGSIVAPALVAALGPRGAFAVVGLILPLVTLVSWSRLRAIDRRLVAPSAEQQVLSEVPLFEPLSLVAKEHLASRLTRVHVDPGEIVVRAGETGDRFYVVGDGELEITNGVRGTARGGDFFGEIALLRDVPRTATVRATSPSELYVLDREDFLAAFTHSAVQAAGDEVVDERLKAGLAPR